MPLGNKLQPSAQANFYAFELGASTALQAHSIAQRSNLTPIQNRTTAEIQGAACTCTGVAAHYRVLARDAETTHLVPREAQDSALDTAVALCPDFIRMSFMGTQKRDDLVLEAQRTRTRPPPLYKVLLLNDDYTPMDFVVLVLQKYFGMDRERATRVMLQVHREGMGVCGVFPRDVATTKVEQVASFARQHQHPLACVMEEN